MSALPHPYLTFDLAHLVAEHLHREEHVERESYEVDARHEFALCDYCEDDQHPAVLGWWWNRPGATTDGSAETCASHDCVQAVLAEALQDSQPEGITVEHPVLAAPVHEARRAA